MKNFSKLENFNLIWMKYCFLEAIARIWLWPTRHQIYVKEQESKYLMLFRQKEFKVGIILSLLVYLSFLSVKYKIEATIYNYNF